MNNPAPRSSFFEKIRDFSDDYMPGGGILRWLGGLLALYLLICVGVGIYWSMAPEPFDVRERASLYAS